MKFDSMYWTDKELPPEVYRELRLEGTVYTGLLIKDAWVKKDAYTGLPRQWARSKGFTGTDETHFPRLDWPVGRFRPRYNQREVIDCGYQRLVSTTGCRISAPPGFGKTLVSLDIASKLHTPTLVLVNKEDLIGQWKNTAEKFFGLEAGHIQENILDYEGRHVTIATIQTLNSRHGALLPHFWSAFGLIVCDEGHRMPCDSFVHVISSLSGRYRLGVSATWRRKDGMEKLWEWHIGNEICIGEKSDIPYRYQKIAVQTTLTDRDFYHRGEISHTKCLTAIARNEGYNQWLVDEIMKGHETRNILLVSHRLEQIERIESLLLSRGLAPGIYVGTYKGKKLKPDQLEDAAKQKVILGTFSKIAEGSDIPHLDTIILATPCTDPQQVCGRVGRSYPGKKFALIIDPVIQSYYNEALFRKREAHYERLEFEKQ